MSSEFPFVFNFTRVRLPGGGYDLNHHLRLDINQDHIQLGSELKTVFPGRRFRIIMDDTDAAICFETNLDAAEQTALNTAVSDHKNNV